MFGLILDSVSTEANQEREYKILKFRPITEKLNLRETNRIS
jgi:hypothetical protein